MKKSALFVVLVLLGATSVFSSGFGLFEHGAKATAMGGAFTAQADDPSAIFYNPAGIAFQKRSLYLETTGIFPDTSFDGSNPYPGVGVSEEMETQKFFPSVLSYIQPINDQWTFGIAMDNPFGLSTRWKHPDRFTGRYISTLAAVRAYRLQPTIAYKPNDTFAIALGVSYFGAKVALEQYLPAVNPYTQSVVNVGHVRLDGGMDYDWGFDFGLMYKFHPKWTLGVSYHSDVTVDFSGDAKFHQIPTGYADFDYAVASMIPFGKLSAKSSIGFPDMASIGISTTAITNWTFELDVDYAGWSSFDELPVSFEGHPELSSTRVTNWDDCYNYRFGFEYRPNDRWAWRGGFVYDESPQPIEDVGPVLPDADRTGYSVGFGYTSGPMTFDFAYMYLDFDNVDTTGRSQDGYYGSYDTSVDLLGVSLTYHFQ